MGDERPQDFIAFIEFPHITIPLALFLHYQKTSKKTLSSTGTKLGSVFLNLNNSLPESFSLHLVHRIMFLTSRSKSNREKWMQAETQKRNITSKFEWLKYGHKVGCCPLCMATALKHDDKYYACIATVSNDRHTHTHTCTHAYDETSIAQYQKLSCIAYLHGKLMGPVTFKDRVSVGVDQSGNHAASCGVQLIVKLPMAALNVNLRVSTVGGDEDKSLAIQLVYKATRQLRG